MSSALALSLLAATAAAPSYEAPRAAAARASLLAADETAWAGASSVEWGPAAYGTRFRAVWTDEGLFLRFDSTDPAPWHTMTRRDEHLWDEEVVEIFLDPDRSGRDARNPITRGVLETTPQRGHRFGKPRCGLGHAHQVL